MTVDFAFYVHWSHSDLAPTEISSATARPSQNKRRHNGDGMVSFWSTSAHPRHLKTTLLLFVGVQYTW